jgi:hypothetical protein
MPIQKRWLLDDIHIQLNFRVKDNKTHTLPAHIHFTGYVWDSNEIHIKFTLQTTHRYSFLPHSQTRQVEVTRHLSYILPALKSHLKTCQTEFRK